MGWVGEVRCPDCQLPIDVDASVCPYCYSSSPASAPWNASPDRTRWPAVALIFGVCAALVGALLSDAYFETRFLQRLLEIVGGAPEQAAGGPSDGVYRSG
jgi:hypothetical protein